MTFLCDVSMFEAHLILQPYLSKVYDRIGKMQMNLRILFAINREFILVGLDGLCHGLITCQVVVSFFESPIGPVH